MPGTPAGIAGFRTTDREKAETIRVELEIGPLCDRFGNTIDRAELLSVTGVAAAPVTTDADSFTPGHQVRFEGGYALLVVETDASAEHFTLEFRQIADGALVARRIIDPIDFQELPATGAFGLAALATAILAARRTGRWR